MHIQPMTKKPARVLRVFEGDSLAQELGRFEYGYQAELFAKALSKDSGVGSGGFYCVLGHGSAYVDDVYCNGRKEPRNCFAYALDFKESGE